MRLSFWTGWLDQGLTMPYCVRCMSLVCMMMAPSAPRAVWSAIEIALTGHHEMPQWALARDKRAYEV